jgi:hypothetical protein
MLWQQRHPGVTKTIIAISVLGRSCHTDGPKSLPNKQKTETLRPSICLQHRGALETGVAHTQRAADLRQWWSVGGPTTGEKEGQKASPKPGQVQACRAAA